MPSQPARSVPKKAAPQLSQPAQLLGLRRDIDLFLDSSSSLQGSHFEPPSPGPEDAGPAASGLSSSQIQRLTQSNEGLQQALEGTRQEVKAKSKAISNLSSTQRSQLSNVKQECSELREDGRAKKRRISEMEDEILKLQGERDKLARDLQEVQERSQCDLQAMELKALDERQRQDQAIKQLESRLERLAEAANPCVHTPLQSRIDELQCEILAMRTLLKEWWPEKNMAAHLQARHIELDREVQQLRSARTDLIAAREQVQSLEQGQASLRAALESRAAALAEEARHEAEDAQQSLADFQEVVLEILQAARDCLKGDVPVQATAPNLRTAWSLFLSLLAKESRKGLQAHRQLDEAVDQQQHLQHELSKLRIEAGCSADLRGQLQSAQSEIERLRAEASVLQETLAGKDPDVARLTARSEEAPLELQKQLAAKQQAIDAITAEAESLRGQVGKLMDLEAKARKLERVNAELWEANKELESRVDRLENTDDADYDPRTTKVLHLARGPAGQVDARSAGGDLEQQQASRQLDRFKRAMRKYVQEFREGIYHLLGWKVEMRGDGSAMRWHLTSRYHEGHELVFQLRPASTAHPADFDLLGTAWAEQLQGDRQAMAYLEVYSSIPGFLAHVTVDRLAQQTFTR